MNNKEDKILTFGKVNEILFFSEVRPVRKIKKLTDFEIQKIVKFSKKIISKAIKFGGSSIKNFSSSSGKKGSFQQHFCVYGKKGENCPKVKCKGKIKKIPFNEVQKVSLCTLKD